MRSIGDQVEKRKNWCESINWRVGRIITDADRSASQWRRREREGWEEAIELIRSGRYGGFATWEPSRAGRDMAIYVQLRAACQQAGALYLTHGRVYDFARSDNSFILGFEFLRAEADANTMRERQLRTARLNAERSRPHGRLLFGYRRVYDERTGVLLGQEPDPHTGELVRMMAREGLAGTSPSQIASMLQDAGEPTPQGSRNGNLSTGWREPTVKQILDNPTMASKRVYRSEVIGDADWEPLISEEDFERIQRIIYDPARRVHVSDGVHPKALLSHIARCHCCGRPLVRTIGAKCKNPTQPRAPKYHCQFRGCDKVVVAAECLDEFASSAAIEWLSQPANISLLTTDNIDWSTRMRDVNARVRKLQARLDEAADQYASGAITLQTLSQVETSLRPQIEEAQRAGVPPIADDGVRALAAADDVRATWEATTFEERRRIIKAVFEVRGKQVSVRRKQAFQLARGRPSTALPGRRPWAEDRRRSRLCGSQPVHQGPPPRRSSRDASVRHPAESSSGGQQIASKEGQPARAHCRLGRSSTPNSTMTATLTIVLPNSELSGNAWGKTAAAIREVTAETTATTRSQGRSAHSPTAHARNPRVGKPNRSTATVRATVPSTSQDSGLSAEEVQERPSGGPHPSTWPIPWAPMTTAATTRLQDMRPPSGRARTT
jgi:DNA invertase Pin-like site-specific DNA recombinase